MIVGRSLGHGCVVVGVHGPLKCEEGRIEVAALEIGLSEEEARALPHGRRIGGHTVEQCGSFLIPAGLILVGAEDIEGAGRRFLNSLGIDPKQRHRLLAASEIVKTLARYAPGFGMECGQRALEHLAGCRERIFIVAARIVDLSEINLGDIGHFRIRGHCLEAAESAVGVALAIVDISEIEH